MTLLQIPKWKLKNKLTPAQIPVLLVLIIGYKFHRYGRKFERWFPERSVNLHGAIQAASEKRKGRLEFPDEGVSWTNMVAFGKWVWIWLR